MNPVLQSVQCYTKQGFLRAEINNAGNMGFWEMLWTVIEITGIALVKFDPSNDGM